MYVPILPMCDNTRGTLSMDSTMIESCCVLWRVWWHSCPWINHRCHRSRSSRQVVSRLGSSSSVNSPGGATVTNADHQARQGIQGDGTMSPRKWGSFFLHMPSFFCLIILEILSAVRWVLCTIHHRCSESTYWPSSKIPDHCLQRWGQHRCPGLGKTDGYQAVMNSAAIDRQVPWGANRWQRWGVEISATTATCPDVQDLDSCRRSGANGY